MPKPFATSSSSSFAMLDALQAVLRHLAVHEDMDQLCVAAIQETATVLRATQCALFTVATDSDVMQVCSRPVGLDATQEAQIAALATSAARFPAAWTPAGVLAALDDVLAELASSGMAEQIRQRIALLTAMRVGDEMIGALWVGSRTDDMPFSAEEAHCVGSFGDQLGLLIHSRQLLARERAQRRLAAIALQNAHLLKETQQHLIRAEQWSSELTVLNQVTAAINSAMHLDEVLALILSQLRRLVPFDRGSILLLEGLELRTVAAAGYPEDVPIVGQRRPWDALPLNRNVIETKHMIAIDDVKQDSRWIVTDAITPVRAWIGVPLTRDDRAIGLLTLQALQPTSYSADQQRLVAAAAEQASLAIEKARLLDEMKKLLQRAEQRSQELKELDRLKNEFVQTVSHELRTPLTFIRGYVELLQEGMLGQLNAQQDEALSTIAQRLDGITRLVNDFFSFARADRADLRLEMVNLGQVARASALGALAIADRAKICIETDIPDDLPPLWGDPQRLTQVFDNLLGNALKFSPDGGRICVRVYASEQMVHATVSDEGIGIPADKLHQVWDRFYQVERSPARDVSGAGLGLAIVKRLIEAHNGQIEVTSTEGEGSTFHLMLPRADIANVPPV